MQIFKTTRLAAGLAATLALAACGADGDGSSTGSGGSGGGGSGGGSGSSMILDETQDQLSGTLTSLCNTISSNTPNGAPIDLGGFICALDPTLNNLLDNPDSLLTGLLTGLQGFLANPSPETLQGALTEIQQAISGDGSYVGLQETVTTLADDLPCALLTLAKQDCGSGSPTDQLNDFIALFGGGANPFAGTPLEPLGELGGGGTGPTGTPLDALLTPLTSILGGASLDGQLVDALGQGLNLLGSSLVDNYETIPGAQDIPLAGDVIATLGNLLSGLGTTLDQLEAGTGEDVGDVLNGALVDVANLLTGPTGLLGSLAEASGQDPLIDAVADGNAQLVGGITQLTNTLSTTLLQPLDETALDPLLGTLAPLTCALQLFGDCSATADPTEALNSVLDVLSSGSSGSDPLTSLVTDITDTLTNGDTGDLTTLLTDNPLATVIDTIIPGGLGGLLGGLGG